MFTLFPKLTSQLGATHISTPSAVPPRPRPSMSVPPCSGYSYYKSVHDFLQELDAHQTAAGVSQKEILWQVVLIALVGYAARSLSLQGRFEMLSEFQSRFREGFCPLY